MKKEWLRKMRLLGTVRFPSATQRTAKISRHAQDPPILVICHKKKTKDGPKAHVKQTVLLEHVNAIVTFPAGEKPIIGDEYGTWLIIKSGGDSTKAFDPLADGKEYDGIAFVLEDAPVLVESTLQEPFVTFAGEECSEVAGDSPGDCISC